jgi:hypothetical protein
MILIHHYETTYPAPEGDEDYCPDGETEQLMVDEPVTFRGLVDLMREHAHPSCSPASGAPFEWLSTEPEQDYRTGEWTERTLHFSRANPPHAARYWRLAMKAAGLIR